MCQDTEVKEAGREDGRGVCTPVRMLAHLCADTLCDCVCVVACAFAPSRRAPRLYAPPVCRACAPFCRARHGVSASVFVACASRLYACASRQCGLSRLCACFIPPARLCGNCAPVLRLRACAPCLWALFVAHVHAPFSSRLRTCVASARLCTAPARLGPRLGGLFFAPMRPCVAHLYSACLHTHEQSLNTYLRPPSESEHHSFRPTACVGPWRTSMG